MSKMRINYRDDNSLHRVMNSLSMEERRLFGAMSEELRVKLMPEPSYDIKPYSPKAEPIYACHPWAGGGSIEFNRKSAARFCALLVRQGYAPIFTPFVFERLGFTECAEDRAVMMDMNKAIIRGMGKMAIAGREPEEWSSGMREEIAYCRQAKIYMIFFPLAQIRDAELMCKGV